MARQSLAQLKSRTFSTRDQGVKMLKANGLPAETPEYRLAKSTSGTWYIEDIDPDASQEVQTAPLNTGKKASALSRIKATKPAAAVTPPPPAQPAPAPPPPAKPVRRGKSSDPDPEELPEGFGAWAFEAATKPEGVLRTELAKKLGSERRWRNYLGDLAKQHGFALEMRRDGRFTRFLMKKA